MTMMANNNYYMVIMMQIMNEMTKIRALASHPLIWDTFPYEQICEFKFRLKEWAGTLLWLVG